jgi:glucose/arabinose dehydrogenase
MKTAFYLFAALLVAAPSPGKILAAGPEFDTDNRFVVEEIARDLGVVWGMINLDDERILFTERSGGLGLLNIRTGVVNSVAGGPAVWAHGQGGLLDIAIPNNHTPNHPAIDWIYLTYSKEQQGKGVTTLARTRLENKNLAQNSSEENSLIDWQDLLVTQSSSDTTRHFGSRIAFDDNGHVFFTVGDRGFRPNGQDLGTHAGSVLRLNLDGTIPSDNPFINRPGALPEIWSYGHRNPQGISYDSGNDRLWINEHGPRGGDEINLVLQGRNYGWPVVSHGKEYWGPMAVGESKYKTGMEAAKKIYIPSIAPASLLFYTGQAFPDWYGSLFSGALKLTHLNRVTVDKSGDIIAEERLLESLNERIRQIIQSPEGWLYLSTDSGKILRIKPH